MSPPACVCVMSLVCLMVLNDETTLNTNLTCYNNISPPPHGPCFLDVNIGHFHSKKTGNKHPL